MNDPTTRPGEPLLPSPRPRGAWEIPLLVAVLAATLWTACFCFPVVWIITGIGEPDKPFLDLRGLISAGDSLRLGLDPHVSNPLDPYYRVHSYSDWWLLPSRLGLSGADLAWVGTGLLALTLATAALGCRPANAREGRDLLLVLVSPPLLMAAHRANNDLVAFVLMGAALAGLRRGGPLTRGGAILLLALSAALKYFPLAAAVLLLEARSRRELLGWAALYGAVLLLAWPGVHRGLGFASAHTPAPAWLYAYGAPVIFRNLEIDGAMTLGRIVAVALLAFGAWRWWPRAPGDRPPATASPEFLAGAAMVVGLFLHGSSYAYKLVFALWLLPWLWGHTAGPGDERWRHLVRWLLLAALWFEGGAAIMINLAANFAGLEPATGVRVLGAALVVGQLLTWAFIVCLWRPLVIHGVGHLRRWVAA
jgi:hypothetical protein